MFLRGTVVTDSSTVIHDGAVVVNGSTIEAVGDCDELEAQYPEHERVDYDILMPGLVGAHVHSVQSLGRGLSDDQELLDWLFDYVLPMEANLTDEQMRLAAELGYLEFIETGTTTTIDHLSVSHADQAIEVAGEMGMRARLGKVMMDQRSPEGLLEETEEALAETERLIETYHNSYDGRIQYAVTPRFAVSCTEECLRGSRELADKYDGVRIHTHASENQDEIKTVEEDTGMRNIHWLDEVGLTGEDVILAHGVWTDETERDIIEETGTNVTHCPSSNMKLASGVAPVVNYLDRGINVALGNDGPPCNNVLDAFSEMTRASMLQKVDSLDSTVTPIETILEMATINGAEAAGFDQVGKLEEGWKADIIGLTTDVTRAAPLHDVLSHLVFSARGDDVEFTMVDGNVLMRDGEVKVADADRIRHEAKAVDLDLSTTSD